MKHQGRIQGFYEGGSTCSTRAKFLGHAHFSENHSHLRVHSTVASAMDQSISKIYAEMSETKSLLATILVREGTLLVQNRDFLVLEQRDRDF